MAGLVSVPNRINILSFFYETSRENQVFQLCTSIDFFDDVAMMLMQHLYVPKCPVCSVPAICPNLLKFESMWILVMNLPPSFLCIDFAFALGTAALGETSPGESLSFALPSSSPNVMLHRFGRPSSPISILYLRCAVLCSPSLSRIDLFSVESSDLPPSVSPGDCMLFSIDRSRGSCLGEGASADALPLPLWYGDFGDPAPDFGDAVPAPVFGEPAFELDQPPCMLCASMLLKCFDLVSRKSN